MRARTSRVLATFLTIGLIGAAYAPAKAADEPNLEGRWKLLLISPLRESEVVLLEIKKHDSKYETAIVGSALPAQVPAAAKGAEVKDGKVTVDLKLGMMDFQLKGKVGKDGNIYGTMDFRGNITAARLDKTDVKVITPNPNEGSAAIKDYMESRQQKDPKAKVKLLTKILEKEGNSPKLAMVYADILGLAEAAGLSEKTVKEFVDTLVENAKPYGERFEAEAQAVALKALAGQKANAALALEVGLKAEKALEPEASTETRADLWQGIAAAAKLAGNKEMTAEAEAKVLAYDARLDEEYHKTHPPFKPEAFAGRKEGDRVVLLELFTGSECPPCVAADVAFDAVNLAYKPTEVVTLQYHLHIPGPDPLTNSDAIARSEYYPEIQGTPSTFFNGKAEAGGGGDLSMSKGKYDDFLQVIGGLLKEKKKADIDLKVEQEGEELKIKATAKAEATAGDAKGKKESKLKLRLALIEEQVRYPGRNKVRFHHHIVRSMPGGPVGKAFEGGEAKFEQTVSLASVRKTIETYLSDFTKENGSSFSAPLPSVSLENVSVVAFVQDDEDKSVLHAVLVPVSKAKAAAGE
ncbi:hypothetical protein [Singulisphaera sp. PoT]|uniref:hypothetical protein n=1 Tax=Singulisphaera sp. PoT TaxID=3411797 RepID=UPI003BF58D37